MNNETTSINSAFNNFCNADGKSKKLNFNLKHRRNYEKKTCKYNDRAHPI